MSYCIAHMIGVRIGEVFSGEADLAALLAVAEEIAVEMRETGDAPRCPISQCMSGALEGGKGSFVVISGVFNYWTHTKAAMSMDEEIDEVRCNIYLRGQPVMEANESPLGRALRRIG